MLNDLIQRRTMLVTELAEKEAELTRIESELASMEDKQFKAKEIEAALQDYYAELFKDHPIDRSQEKEISDTIKEKQVSIQIIETKRKADIKKAESIWYNLKTRETTIKAANKAYLDELKRVFGEIEIDIKRFYKKGISKIDLIILINIMDSICSRGSKVGTLPLSFQQKVYKWQQTVKELPDDEERINKEKEEEAKQKLSASFKSQKLELTEIRKNIKSSKQSCSLHQNELEKQKALLVEYEQMYSAKKQKIDDDATARKEKLQAKFETECREIKTKCAERKEEIQKELIELQWNIDKIEQEIAVQKKEQQDLETSYSDVKKQHQEKVREVQTIIETNRKELERLKEERNKLSESYEQIKEAYNKKVNTARQKIDTERKILEQLKAEKNSKDEAAQKTFILSFGKKRELREQAESITLRISQEEQTIQQLESDLSALYDENPDQITEHPLRNQLKEIDSLISVLRNELQSREVQLKSMSEKDPDRDAAHPLRVRIAEVTSLIEKYTGSIESNRNKIASLMAENPEQDKEKAILEYREQLSREVEEIERTVGSQVTDLDHEKEQIEKKIQKQQALIDKEKKTLETLQETLKDKEKEAREVEQSLNDFHIDYIIKKYSKKFRLNDQLTQKKSDTKEITSEIKKLNKEIADIDKKIASAEKAQMRQAEEDRKQQIKKAKEEETNRRIQEERQQRIIRELQERDLEQEIIQDNTVILNRLKSFVQTLEEDDASALLDMNSCPLQDDGKRVITNSIVRKQYMQAGVGQSCNLYALVFVDHFGNAISEMRLIKRKPEGEMTKTSFELKSNNGFEDAKYYLLIINFESAELICAQKYIINISFSNDFDF